jgi:hypothetical protein
MHLQVVELLVEVPIENGAIANSSVMGPDTHYSNGLL